MSFWHNRGTRMRTRTIYKYLSVDRRMSQRKRHPSLQPGGEYVKYLIGVDIGTQGTKAALYDENMTLVGTAFVNIH